MNKMLIARLDCMHFLLCSIGNLCQEQTQFKKENFSYNEWTKRKFSEVVTVTNLGRLFF